MSKGLIIGGGLAAIALVGIASVSGGASATTKKIGPPPPPPPPPRTKVDAAAQATLDKLAAVKRKADAGNKKAQDTVNTLRDLYGRLKS